MSVVIRFTRLVASPQYGNCGPGEILRCSEAFARHCVSDLKSAQYVAPAAPAAPAPVVTVRRRRKIAR